MPKNVNMMNSNAVNNLVENSLIENLNNNQAEFKDILTNPPNVTDRFRASDILRKNDADFLVVLLDIIISLMIKLRDTTQYISVSLTIIIYQKRSFDMRIEGDKFSVDIDGENAYKRYVKNLSAIELRKELFVEYFGNTLPKMYLVYYNHDPNRLTVKCNHEDAQKFINDNIKVRYDVVLQLSAEILNPILSVIDVNKLYIVRKEINPTTIIVSDTEIVFLRPGEHMSSTKKQIVQLNRRPNIPIGMSLRVVWLPDYSVLIFLDYLLDVQINTGDTTIDYRGLKNKLTNTSPLLKLYAHLEKGGSARLNTGLLERIITGIPIDDERDVQYDLKKRAIQLLDAYASQIDVSSKDKCDRCDREFIVYHGSLNKLHANNDTFQCLAFLSTTLSWQVATDYARGGCIYAIKIPVNYPFLHLEDYKLFQILLPLGCTIKVMGSITINSNTVFQCECVNDYSKQRAEMLKSEFQCVSVFPPLKPGVRSFIRLNEFNDIKKINATLGSSVFHETVKNGQRYFIKSITKASNNRRDDKGGNYILKRVVNEVLATIVYNFYGLETFHYDIIYNDSANSDIDIFSLGSTFVEGVSYKYEYFTNVKQAVQVLSGFLVDCIVSNWDAGNNNNIGFLNGNTVHTDVGGALAFHGTGSLNIAFYNDAVCTEHKTFLDPSTGTGNFFSHYLRTLEKNDIELSDVANATLKNVDINSIFNYPPILQLKQKIVDANIDNRYITFIDNILNRVVYRHKYYVSFGGQIGGKRKTRKIAIKGSTRVYTVRKDKMGKTYIVKQNKTVPLKNIRGKYRYIMQGGDNDSNIDTKPVETPRDPEIFVSTAFFDEMMSSLSESCQKSGGKKSNGRGKKK